MKIIKGIAVSDGIGTGKVRKIIRTFAEQNEKNSIDKTTELKKFENAVEKFCQKTAERAKKIRKFSVDDAKILEIHIMIAKDKFFTEKADRLIDGGLSAVLAVEQILSESIETLTSANDNYTKQRIADITDIKNELIGAISGTEKLDLHSVPKNTVLVLSDITPSMTAGINTENTVGIIAEKGSFVSHSAIILRSMGIPAVFGVKDALSLTEDSRVIVDGTNGKIISQPNNDTIKNYNVRQKNILNNNTVPKYNRDYKVLCNISNKEDSVKSLTSDGVGLFRTEFLFMGRALPPTEDEQFEIYKQTALLLNGKPLNIRTADIGGDKSVNYLKQEENPFLGCRAVRYSLKNRDFFITQIRAILRASIFGNIKILLPFITTVEEVRDCKLLIDKAKSELKAEGVAFDRQIKVGIMIETPSAGLIADLLADEADFFSIGSNDLAAYITACDRNNSEVSNLYSVFQPSVLRLIRYIIECGLKKGIPVELCGESAADPMMMPLLISFGLKNFSVHPLATEKTKKQISQWTKTDADKIAGTVMDMKTEEEIYNYLKSVLLTI